MRPSARFGFWGVSTISRGFLQFSELRTSYHTSPLVSPSIHSLHMPRDLARTPLFHITDVDNLAGIVASGGLLSDSRLVASGGPNVDIGYKNMKQRRMTQTRIPCAGNRFVGEFVPFYFCPRSVMLYTVNIGKTGKALGCQRSILHLVTSVADAMDSGSTWAYSDGNAGASYPNFYNEIDDLDIRLNWSAINERANWSAVRTEKQAEFLVADTYSWNSILAIGCYEDAVAQRVTAILKGVQHRPTVTVERGWYY
jgi:ssDNA thymidine ADP-ribosyltransferase, DarT